MCDGSTADIIVGEIDTDITLITCAGLVEIPRATVDVLRGPQKGHILYVGQQEEERLGLVSYADQVKLLAARLNTDKNVDNNKSKDKPGSKAAGKRETIQLKGLKDAKTAVFKPGEKPRFKRRLGPKQILCLVSDR